MIIKIRWVSIFTVGMLMLPLIVRGAMSSTNYYIYADNVGLNGGAFTSSSIYALENTGGESAVGVSVSNTYEIRAGYQAMDLGGLSMTLSNSSLNLGTLSTNQVNSANTTVTISSASDSGFTLSLANTSGVMPQAVADGSVTAGNEEYGMAVSGSHSVVAGDVAVTARALASAPTSTILSVTVLTFKASISNASAPGTYNQNIILVASANL